MKTITIGTKAQADKALVNSLFQPVNGRTLNRERLDAGKYKPDASFIGREVEVSDDVVAVYQVRQRDGDGPYIALHCITA